MRVCVCVRVQIANVYERMGCTIMKKSTHVGGERRTLVEQRTRQGVWRNDALFLVAAPRHRCSHNAVSLRVQWGGKAARSRLVGGTQEHTRAAHDSRKKRENGRAAVSSGLLIMLRRREPRQARVGHMQRAQMHAVVFMRYQLIGVGLRQKRRPWDGRDASCLSPEDERPLLRGRDGQKRPARPAWRAPVARVQTRRR